MNNRIKDNAMEQCIPQVLEKIRELRKNIMEASVNRDHIWFRNLLCGILNCAMMDYKSVEIGAQKSAYLAAWGCRNLLELKVITEYILASKKNALDFKNELAIDAKEFYEAIGKRHRSIHKQLLADVSEMAEKEEGLMKEVLSEAFRNEAKRGPQTEESDSEAEVWRQLISEFGLKNNSKPKRISDIASQINKKESFDPMFKICSKIMHRTCFSIASSMIQGSLDAMISFLADSGVCEMLSIYQLINKYHIEYGVQPPQ
jgi:hypothetical protein